MEKGVWFHVGSWKDGEHSNWDFPTTKDETLRAVYYDQKYNLYSVWKEDLQEFDEWVGLTWASENDPWPDDMLVGDYLDNIGVSILVRPSIGFKDT